jgi:Transglycosylase
VGAALRRRLVFALVVAVLLAFGLSGGYLLACRSAEQKLIAKFREHNFLASTQGVSLGMRSARIKGLHAILKDDSTASIQFDADDVYVQFAGNIWLGNRTVDAVMIGTNTLRLQGGAENLRALMRKQQPSDDDASSPGKTTSKDRGVHGLHLLWEHEQNRLEVTGANVQRGANGLSLAARDATFDSSFGRVVARELSVQVEGALAAKNLRDLRAKGLDLDASPEQWARILAQLGAARGATLLGDVPSQVGGPVGGQLGGPKESIGSQVKAESTPAPVAKPRSARSARLTKNELTPGAGTFPSLPSWGGWRARFEALLAIGLQHVPDGLRLTIEQLAFNVPDLHVGPGEYTFSRAGEGVRASFASLGTGQNPPLRATADWPSPRADLVLELDGGPVSAAGLGLREGTLYLADIEKAKMQGKARLVLAPASGGVTFDVDVRLFDAGFASARLARQTLHRIDASVRARGQASGTQVRLDDSQFRLGTAAIGIRGLFDVAPERAAVRAAFSVPLTTCQAMLDQAPEGLLPTLKDVKMAGTFSAEGQIALDSAHLDDMDLHYRINDGCNMTEVPRRLSKDHFARTFQHRVYLPDGKVGEETLGPGSGAWTDFAEISPFMQASVFTTEDAGFHSHHGFSHRAIRDSIVANLKARRFARGASTITMQLAKNAFLSREKTLSRKIEEVILTDYLEEHWSKDEIMELYLNIVEFGPGVYGVTKAADYYFGRSPSELNLAECMFLASVLPSPLKFAGARERGQLGGGWQKHIDTLIRIAGKSGKVSDADASSALGQPVVFRRPGEARPNRRSPALVHGAYDEDPNSSWQEVPQVPEP